MKSLPLAIAGIVFGLAALSAQGTDRFVSPNGGNIAPFNSWANAATNIQDAIDASGTGDVVWVTNGVYASGGKVMAGDLTNRVALDKPLTVRSVNGPFVTTILGSWDPATTNGPLASRCAWVTNGATLMGFTLQGGATRNTGTATTMENGGGAWCNAADANVTGCLLLSNSAYNAGCGAYGGTLKACAIIGSIGKTSAGASFSAALLNCTVISNSCGGASSGSCTNTILFYNKPQNYSGTVLSYCCSDMVPSSGGNIAGPPQLLDGIHLASTSICLQQGTNVATSLDIDGELWAAQPSIGCDEWHGAPLLKVQPKLAFTVNPVGFSLGTGLVPTDAYACWWIKDGIELADGQHFNGTKTTNLVAAGAVASDAGAYQLIVSNSFGVVTSAVAQVTVHLVDGANSSPSAPYLDWATAATSIQDAIDAALPGEIVVVTNGVYATGGKVMAGDLTNRVALNKSLLVLSANGASFATIQGARDPASTNGPAAIRCAWLTNGAILSGFSLEQGATRTSGDTVSLQSGGGAWGSSSNAVLADCRIRGNAASAAGGGAFGLGLLRCVISENSASTGGGGASWCNITNSVLSGNSSASSGGGASISYLRNSPVLRNVARLNGGGVDGCTLVNCTVASNSAGVGATSTAQAGGAYNSKLTNCIVYANQCLYPLYTSTSNSFGCSLGYCCTAPVVAGTGNISADPQFLSDGLHIAETSPCRATGASTAVTGTDIDGQPWANPPAMGADEWLPIPVLGGAPSVKLSGPPLVLVVSGFAAGQAPLGYFWLKDSVLLQAGGKYASVDKPTLTVAGFGPEDAGAYQLVATNALGMATSAVAKVVVRCSAHANPTPVAPYFDWATAASTLQDAIDAAAPGDFVLATNGVYSSGGRVIAGDLTNRVTLTKTITVASINGPALTVIQGAFDPVTTNGPLAVRDAFMSSGAVLRGFTLRNGATRSSGDALALMSGGGLWCADTNVLVVGCVLSNNVAATYGGGCYQGKLQSCTLTGNLGAQGGGAYGTYLSGCRLYSNTASFTGGGALRSLLLNCTVMQNIAPFSSGGGIASCSGWNSIIFGNLATGLQHQFDNNDWDTPSKTALLYCWTTSDPYSHTLPSPQLVDGIHLAATSPCRGAGNALYASGTDIDGESWSSPPSIGCDEFYESDFTGPLLLSQIIAYNEDRSTPVVQGAFAFLEEHLTGNASRLTWSYGDGTGLTNQFAFYPGHSWTNAGDYNVTFTAYNYDNPDGVSTNVIVHVVPPDPPVLTGTVNGTDLNLTFTAQNGLYYVVEKATDLAPPITWAPLATVRSFGTAVAVKDSNATNTSAFYRVRTR